MLLSYELTAEIIGYAGGIVLAIALAPQVCLVLKTKSTKDISYSWQIIYILGLALNYVYFLMIKATAAWITLTVEVGFAVWLLYLKIKIDGFGDCGPIKTTETTKASIEFKRSTNEPSLSSVSEHSIGDSNTTIRLDGNVDLDLEIGCLKYKDAIKFRRDSTVKADTLVCEAFRGFHIMIDVVFTTKLAHEFGNALLAKMVHLAGIHGVRVMHDHACIFDGTESPPGFAVGALLDESHMTAHCYSDEGKLAFDVFTCGAKPDSTRKVARDVLTYLKQHVGDDAVFNIHRMPRFPEKYLGTDMQ